MEILVETWELYYLLWLLATTQSTDSRWFFPCVSCHLLLLSKEETATPREGCNPLDTLLPLPAAYLLPSLSLKQSTNLQGREQVQVRRLAAPRVTDAPALPWEGRGGDREPGSSWNVSHTRDSKVICRILANQIEISSVIYASRISIVLGFYCRRTRCWDSKHKQQIPDIPFLPESKGDGPAMSVFSPSSSGPASITPFTTGTQEDAPTPEPRVRSMGRFGITLNIAAEEQPHTIS